MDHKLKITIIGDGGWGTALAVVLNKNGHPVTVWGPFCDNIALIQHERENITYLPGIPLPPAIRWSSTMADALQEANIVVLAVPTQYYSDVLQQMTPHLPRDVVAVSVTKGLDRESHRTMTEIASQHLDLPVAALSGPSHAEEVAQGIPTAVVIAAHHVQDQLKLQSVFNAPTFRVYTSQDVTGVQIGGALKNVIAIAVGISDGLGYGDNTRAALITRGLGEITRLGIALGCEPETFSGLSGMGDLIVTCTSKHSRNRSVGERLGRGESLASVMGSMKQVAEGVWNARQAAALASEHHVEVPITDQVCRILHDGFSPREAVTALMNRDIKPERPF